MNAEELSNKLHGIDWRKEPNMVFPNNETINIAKENGLVIAFGWSDDLVELDGAIVDEKDKEGKLHIDRNGFCSNKKSKSFIKASFGNEVYDWKITSNIPHSVFIFNDSMNESSSQGIVFSVNDIAP